MSLRIGLSRSHSYALVSGDRVIYGDDPRSSVIGELPRSTLLAVSDFVLLARGGCVALGETFVHRLRARTRHIDDLAAVEAAARAIVAELEHEDSEHAETRVWSSQLEREVIRCSIRDHFSIQLIGFHHDGRTGIAQYDAGTWDAYDDGEGQLTIGFPYGVDADSDVVPFYRDFYESPGCPSAAEAFSFAFGAHRILGRKYPERITSHVDVNLLRWNGPDQPPAQSTFTLEREALEAFFEIHEQLKGGAGPGRNRARAPRLGGREFRPLSKSPTQTTTSTTG